MNLTVPKYTLYHLSCTESVILRRQRLAETLTELIVIIISSNWYQNNRRKIEIYIDLLLPCYCVLSSVECYSNFSRYDGIRYGLKESDTFRLYKNLRSIGYGLNIRQNL